MLRTMIMAAACTLAATVAQADGPPVSVEVPATNQTARIVSGTVVEATGGSDMHGGWVEVSLAGMPEGQTTTFSDIVYPYECATPGAKFYIIFSGTSTTITCGEPTK